MDRFVCIDVEMPNGDNDRISAIGVAEFVGGVVTQRFYALINPETWFQPFVISLIGITPEMVADAPTFLQYWPTIAPLLTDSVLVAHGAGNDLKALSGCLRHYGIDWQSETKYICTVDACTACYPDRGSYGLEGLCNDFGIALDHHNALSDAEGCGRLLLQCMCDGLDVETVVKSFNLQDGHGAGKRRRKEPRKKAAALAAQEKVRRALQPYCTDAQREETAARLLLLPEQVLGVPPQTLLEFAKTHRSYEYMTGFLKALPHDYPEENLLHAWLVSNRSRFAQTLKAIDAFLPFVDNAETCAALQPKTFSRKQPELGSRLRKWLLSEHKYTVLFALQTLERCYIKTPMLPMFLDIAASIATDDAELRQAKAAFFAKVLCLSPQTALAFLGTHDLGDLARDAAKLAMANGGCSKATKQALDVLLGEPAMQ